MILWTARCVIDAGKIGFSPSLNSSSNVVERVAPIIADGQCMRQNTMSRLRELDVPNPSNSF